MYKEERHKIIEDYSEYRGLVEMPNIQTENKTKTRTQEHTSFRYPQQKHVWALVIG